MIGVAFFAASCVMYWLSYRLEQSAAEYQRAAEEERRSAQKLYGRAEQAVEDAGKLYADIIDGAIRRLLEALPPKTEDEAA